jgi:hypothetical protein
MKPNPAITLPTDLSPETALALFDRLNGLTNALWQHDEIELTELTMAQRNQYPASQQAFNFDDHLPF